MAKVQTLQTTWSGGELSPRLDGRPDLKKFSQGARVVENFLVMPHGGVRKRSGTKFVIEQPATSDVAMTTFQYSTEQSYVLLFGHNYVWFFRDGGIITDSPLTITGVTRGATTTITSNSHGLSNGQRVFLSAIGGTVELNNRWFIVANKTANTFEIQNASSVAINSSGYTAYTSGGTASRIIELTTTYTSSQVQELQFAQSADTLYIVHKDHPLRKLQRSSHTSWTLSTPSITTGPFRTVNGDRTLKIVPSFASATITNITQANPAVVTTSATHAFTNGQYVTITGVVGMTEVNTLSFIVANATATTFELQSTDSTGFTAYASGGTATLSPSAFGTHIVGAVCTLTATGGHTPFTSTMVGSLMRLSEEGASSGYQAAPVGNAGIPIAVGDVYTNSGKVYGISATTIANWQPINRVPSHDSGTIRVYNGSVSIGTYFDSAFLHPTYCVVEITGYTSSTVVTARIVRYHMPKSIVDSGTSFWEEGAWSERRGYPRAIAFYEQRLFLAGGESDPTVVWSSRSGAYENFEDGSQDSDALVYRVPGRSADVIRWLHAGRVLTAGSSFGEFAFASSSQNQALTPSNVKASAQTSFGSSSCLPLPMGQAVLYPQRNGNASNPAKKLREFQYRYDQDAFGSTDLTVFSEHIFGDGITRLAYQTEPDSIIWALRNDGTLAACTYERQQEVVAWHRHELGGTSAAVKAIAVMPSDDGDVLWMSVQRTIGGSTVRYIEYMVPTFKDDDDKADAKILDCHATYSGASSSTITGLWLLAGEAVTILNNGSVETGTVSAAGTLTLARATTKAHIGYAYTATVESEDLEAGAQAGTAQSRAKRISQIYLRVLNSLGGSAGPDTSNQKTLLYRRPSDPMGTSAPLTSGFIELDFPGGWERFARVRVEHDEPLPFHLTSMVVEISTTG